MNAGSCRRRVAFGRARAPVAVAMRVVAASIAESARAAGAPPPARRSVFVRRANAGVVASFEFDGLAGTRGPFDKDLH